MIRKLLNNFQKLLIILLLPLGLLGLETASYSLVNPSAPLQDNFKLVLDTRAQLALNRQQTILNYQQGIKQKILSSLDKVALRLTPQDKQQMTELIYKESQEQNVDPQLIVAVIKTESEFREKAISRAGAHGLMQVRLPTAQEVAREMGMKWQGRKSLYKPCLNIKMGTYYLAKMCQRFENLELALTAYNMGPTALRRLMNARNNIPQRYSRRVLKIYQQLKQNYWGIV